MLLTLMSNLGMFGSSAVGEIIAWDSPITLIASPCQNSAISTALNKDSAINNLNADSTIRPSLNLNSSIDVTI